MIVASAIFSEYVGLGNKTPAEAAGIVIQGHNKMITVIQNAVPGQKLS